MGTMYPVRQEQRSRGSRKCTLTTTHRHIKTYLVHVLNFCSSLKVKNNCMLQNFTKKSQVAHFNQESTISLKSKPKIHLLLYFTHI